MANLYDSQQYPLMDIILTNMMYTKNNLCDMGMKRHIYTACVSRLLTLLYDQTQVRYLDFDLKCDKSGDFVEIISNNIITALWFCGIFPYNVEDVILKNKYHLEDGYYSFSEKTKKLKFYER
jgi:hypothetical protein